MITLASRVKIQSTRESTSDPIKEMSIHGCDMPMNSIVGYQEPSENTYVIKESTREIYSSEAAAIKGCIFKSAVLRLISTANIILQVFIFRTRAHICWDIAYIRLQTRRCLLPDSYLGGFLILLSICSCCRYNDS